MNKVSSQLLQEVFLLRSLVSDPLEISPEEYFEVQRAAKQTVERFVTDLCAVSVDTPAELIRNLDLQLANLSKDEVEKSAAHGAARVELADATRYYAAGARERESILKYASPNELSDELHSSSMQLPTGCVWLLNDVSPEERFATRRALACRIAHRRRDACFFAFRAKATEFEAKRAICNELRRLISNPSQLLSIVTEKKAAPIVTTSQPPTVQSQSVAELNVSSTSASSKNAKSRSSASRVSNTSSSSKAAPTNDTASVPGFMRPTIASRISTSQSQVQMQSVNAGQSRLAGATGPANSTRSASAEAAKKLSTAPVKSAFAPVPRMSSSSASGKAKNANVSGAVPTSESLSESVNVAIKAHDLIEQLFFDDCSASNLRVASIPASASIASGNADVPKVGNAVPALPNANGLSFSIFADQTVLTGGTAAPSMPIVNIAAADKENKVCFNFNAPAPDFEIYHDSVAQDDRATGPPTDTAQPRRLPNLSQNTQGDLVPPSPAGSAVEFSTTPRLLRARLGYYDQSVVETPSRFKPPLSSTVIMNLPMALDDAVEDLPLYAQPRAVAIGYEYDECKVAAPEAARHEEAPRTGLSPHCVTTPQRTNTEASERNCVDSGAVASTQSGVNPILDGMCIFEQQLKDTDNDDDVPRRNNFRKPRRSSTTFQHRVVVEMSPIVEVSASTSSSSNYYASASVSHSQSSSRTRSQSQSDTQEADRASQTNNLDEDDYPVSKSRDAQLLKPNIISNCPASSIFDYLKPYFPKGLQLLDVNANKMGSQVSQDPCSTASQLANLEHCGFLRAVVNGYADCFCLQPQSDLPHILAPQGGVVGAITYESARLLDNSAFGNCYLLRKRQSDGSAYTDVSVKLLLARSPDSDAEGLRLEGVWEAYILLQVAQRKTQLQLQLSHDDTARRFLSGFLQLDHAVLLRNGAALVYRLSSCAFITLGTLLETARSLRANESTHKATLPFNEALTHLCTIELCEVVLTIVQLGLLHTDLRPENLMIRRGIQDLQSSGFLRSGEPLMKLANFGSAVDMHFYGVDHKFGCDATSRRVGLCPAMLDGCSWSYDLDVYSAALIVQSLIQSSSETFHFEKRGDEWRESVPLKRRWNVKMWENFFRDALNYSEMKTRDETLSKLYELTRNLRCAFELKRTEKLPSLVTDLKCLFDHL